MADVVVVNKVDSARIDDIGEVIENVEQVPFGAGTVAARRSGATVFVDPRPYSVGSIAETYRKYRDIGTVLPAMGYGGAQLHELEVTIQATDCHVVVVGTPMDLGRLIAFGHPARQVSYEYEDEGPPTLRHELWGFVDRLVR